LYNIIIHKLSKNDVQNPNYTLLHLVYHSLVFVCNTFDSS
jgi:hypothetical protein